MKLISLFSFLILFVIAVNSCDTTPSSSDPKNELSSLVNYYDVPFFCSVKPGLGCGSAAKPVIMQLLKDSNVKHTRLNHQGSILEVTWSTIIEEQIQKEIIKNAFSSWGYTPIQLNSDSIQNELTTEVWYADLAVDSLSLEEATENALILIEIIENIQPLDDRLRDTLFKNLENYYRSELVLLREKDPLNRWEKELNEIISGHFEKSEFPQLDLYR